MVGGQTGSIPREEKDVEKPRPIPRCVCVCERAISYCTSRLRNISSCCCSVFMPSALRSPEDATSSACGGTKCTVTDFYTLECKVVLPLRQIGDHRYVA